MGFFIRSFFARPKNEPKKGAGNDNFSLFVRLLHNALTAPPKSLKFAPFLFYPRASIFKILSI
jgi:hypothetical protein